MDSKTESVYFHENSECKQCEIKINLLDKG